VAAPRPADDAAPIAPAADAAGHAKGRCILVIDDDSDVRSLLAHLLRQNGWDVWTAESAAHAREHVAARHHDALLLDFRLGDGSEPVGLLRSLDELRPGSSRRCVMISGSLSHEMPLEQLPPVLLKPFSHDELEAAIAARLVGVH
jgi:DNA-binding NtrC family response regulator